MSSKITLFRRALTDEVLDIVSTAELLRDEIKFASMEEVIDFVRKQRINLELTSSRMDKILSRIADESVALMASTEWARRVQSVRERLLEIEEFTQLFSWKDNLSDISIRAALIIAYLNGAGATITLYEDRTE